MRTQYILTVVVPVYNAENTIAECLESLLGEDYDEFELIIINDGSKDNTTEVIELYADKFKYIEIINTPNGGVSVARNMGIKNAHGEYIYFLDADDAIVNGLFTIFSESLKKFKDIDIIIGDYIDSEDTINPDLCKFMDIKNLIIYEREAGHVLLKDLFEETFLYILLSRSFFKTSICRNNNIFFNEKYIIGEDFTFFTHYIAETTNALIVKHAFYFLEVSVLDQLLLPYHLKKYY